ncbi:ABC transporter ATP-binding protein [Paenibacillus sp. CAU 1782]
MEEQQAIVFDGIHQKRSNFEIGPITLGIPEGFITAIVGPNGSGKSTLFRMALDLSKPDHGKVTMLGSEVGGEGDHLIKQRIGYLAEGPFKLDDNLKACDKARYYSGWYPNWNVNRYQELLHILGVNDNQRMSKMSKGMRRKFEFALAIAHSPELLLLDEPSSGLDPIAWKTMIDVLHRYMGQGGRTILMNTHIIEEVKRLADYIVFMAQGRVLGMYEKDELFGNWFTLYVSGDGLTSTRLADLPGQCSIEPVGASAFRVVTGKAWDAEEWCRLNGIDITSRQALELDDILAAHLQRDGLGSRVHETRGLFK